MAFSLNPRKKVEEQLEERVMPLVVERAVALIKERGEQAAKAELTGYTAGLVAEQANQVVPAPMQMFTGSICEAVTGRVVDRAMERALEQIRNEQGGAGAQATAPAPPIAPGWGPPVQMPMGPPMGPPMGLPMGLPMGPPMGPPMGQMPMGQMPMGQMPMGQVPPAPGWGPPVQMPMMQSPMQMMPPPMHMQPPMQMPAPMAAPAMESVVAGGTAVATRGGGKGVLIAVLVLLLLGGGGAAVWFFALRDQGEETADSGDESTPAAESPEAEPAGAAKPAPVAAGAPTAAAPADPPAADPAAGAAAPAAAAATASWDGTSTFTCRGMDQVRLSGVVAHLAGDGITATGNCELICEGCTIEAARAVSATGNAQLTFLGGRVTGTERAAYAGGNAIVTFTGVAVTGPVETGGFGAIKGLEPAVAAGGPATDPGAGAPAGTPPTAADPPAADPTATAPSPPAATAGDDRFAGTWTIARAQAPRGKTYTGTVVIAPFGTQGAYQVTWKTSGGEYTGTGLRAGADQLYVAWGPGEYAIGVYELHGSDLSGRFTMPAAAGVVASEKGAKAARKLAARHRTEGTLPGGQTYKGELALKDKGDVWDVSWYIDKKKMEGVGIPATARAPEAGEFPVVGVAYGKRDVGIVRYQLHGDGELRGVWALHGQRSLAVEDLTR